MAESAKRYKAEPGSAHTARRIGWSPTQAWLPFLVGLALCLSLVLGISGAPRAQTKPTITELGQLPQYCWSRFDTKLEGTPGYSIPSSCGAGMNHFCSGLTFMLRARKPGAERNAKAEDLRMARGEIDYTLKRMTPNCPISADVRLADQRLRVMETAAGIRTNVK